MSEEPDLLAAVPEPPPPRPDRRQLAIDEALRRFDAPDYRPQRPRRAVPARSPFARPQLVAFVTLLLVAAISVPLWISNVRHQGPSPADVLRPPIASDQPPAPPPARAAPPAGLAPPTPPVLAPAPPPPVEAPAAPSPVVAAAPVAAGQVAEAEPAQAKAVSNAANSPDRLDRFAVRANSGQAFASSPPPVAANQVAPAPPPPPPPAASAALAETDSARAADKREIVVTGSRVERPFGKMEADTRGAIVTVAPNDDAWNECTVLDKRHSLRACRQVVDPGAPGSAGRAAAHVADGLSAAWQGDVGNAIKAFDEAIAAAPDWSLAYLNRGLAYQSSGNSDRALADFGRAIACDPGSASAYYHRSLLLRARGETARADADLKRASQLDPHSAAILPPQGSAR